MSTGISIQYRPLSDTSCVSMEFLISLLILFPSWGKHVDKMKFCTTKNIKTIFHCCGIASLMGLQRMRSQGRFQGKQDTITWYTGAKTTDKETETFGVCSVVSFSLKVPTLGVSVSNPKVLL